MSETPITPETSEDRAHVPVWKTFAILVSAIMSATMAPFLVCLCTLPVVLVLFSIIENAAPQWLLTDMNFVMTATLYATSYFGIALTFCMSIQFVVFGIPTALVGWRLGRITPRSSILAGCLVGSLPWLFALPFNSPYGLDYPVAEKILVAVGPILIMGVLGAIEGFIFWHVWRFLSRRSVPTKSASDLG